MDCVVIVVEDVGMVVVGWKVGFDGVGEGVGGGKDTKVRPNPIAGPVKEGKKEN